MCAAGIRVDDEAAGQCALPRHVAQDEAVAAERVHLPAEAELSGGAGTGVELPDSLEVESGLDAGRAVVPDDFLAIAERAVAPGFP